MKNNIKKVLQALLLVAFAVLPLYALSVDAEINSKVVSVYDKIEITVKTDVEVLNPYDLSNFTVKGYFRSPSKETIEVDGFYMKEFAYDPDDGSVTDGLGIYKIRFTPKKAGTWTYHFIINEAGSRIFRSKQNSFYVKSDPEKKGFITASRSDPLFFENSDKTPFFASGAVIESISDKNYAELETLVADMKAAGMNTIKIIMSREGFSPEWTGEAGIYEKTQQREFIMDMLLSLCEKEKIRVILSLFSYRDFQRGQWEKNPYNTNRDGVLASPEEFFSNEIAVKLTKNRIRYIIARWGYSPAVLGWELFEFPDFLESYAQMSVILWHKLMATFVKKYDQHKHLISAGYYNPYNEPAVYYLKEIDFTQSSLPGIREAWQRVYEVSKYKVGKFVKPHLVTGFGTGITPGEHTKLNEEEEQILHDTLWSGVFTLSAGVPLVDEYDASKDGTFAAIKVLNALTAEIKWPTDDLYDIEQTQFYYKFYEEEKPRDLVIYSTDTPAGICENILVKEDGKVINKDRFCSKIGGEKPERFFSFKNSVPVKFKIGIGGAEGSSKLIINHNGEELRTESVASENGKFKFRELSIDIPIGDNEVKIINETGTIYVEYVAITDFLNPKNPPVFGSGMQSEKALYMWVKNLSNTPLKTISYDAKGLRPQRYSIKFYNTYDGSLIKEYEDIADKEALKITFPEFEKDVFVKVRGFKK